MLKLIVTVVAVLMIPGKIAVDGILSDRARNLRWERVLEIIRQMEVGETTPPSPVRTGIFRERLKDA